MAKLTPWDWQVRDVDTLEANNFTGLLAIEAGGTKTFITALAIERAKPNVTLIIAPQSTHETAWIPTIRDNVGVTPRIMGNGKKAHREALTDFLFGYPGVYLVTPQWVTRTDVSEWRGDMLIHDESHQGATPRSKLQRKLGGGSVADDEPLAERFTMRLALSGTPLRQAFENAWGTMRFLWGHLDRRGEIAHSSIFLWKEDRMDFTTVYTNQRDRDGKPKTVKQFNAEKEPGRLLSEMPCVIQHKRRETCCDAHPGGFLTADEPQVIERLVELTAKQKKNIREMNTMMLTYIKDHPLDAKISLTQKQRIRQLTLAEATVEKYEGEDAEGNPVDKSRIIFDEDAKSPFLDEVIHILSNLPEGEPVVLFGESQKFVEIVTKRLTAAGYKAEEYSGVRKADLSGFGKDYRVLVGVVSALGTGTDGLQNKCNTEIWLEQPVSLTMRDQSRARLDRMNGKQVQRYMLMDDAGVQGGRLEDMWATEAMVRRSLTKAA